MTLQLPAFDALPPPPKEGKLLEIPIADLKPTQMCVGLAEVQHRRKDFATDSLKERRKYLSDQLCSQRKNVRFAERNTQSQPPQFWLKIFPIHDRCQWAIRCGLSQIRQFVSSVSHYAQFF